MFSAMLCAAASFFQASLSLPLPSAQTAEDVAR
jgi:hypothetical protein